MSDSIKPSFTDILKSIPGVFGIRLEEEPAYEVLDTVGDVEIRRYAPALLAEVTVPGDHDTALDSAFTTLARYIYGGNSADETMSMTSPVLQRREGDDDGTPMRFNRAGDGWSIAFFLANNLAAKDAPVPDDPSVQLVMHPTTVLASLRYRGNNSAEHRAEAKATLLKTLAASNRWRVADDVLWAQYDQPFAIPFLKRNEAMVPVRERS